MSDNVSVLDKVNTLDKENLPEKVNVQINGTTHTIEKGTRILDYLLSQDIQHPHICRGAAVRPTLDAINTLVAEDLKEVNALILRRMESSVPLIPQIAGHIVAGGGKRIRPS